MKCKLSKLKLNISVATLIILIVVTSFPISFRSAEAAINEQINYQGKLTDTSNVAVADGDWRMYFRLYTDETGGTAIWTGNRSTAPGDQITITSGLFSAMLGSSTSLTGIDFNQTLYLGVEICGLGSGAESCDGEMTPRKILGAVPAAFEAAKLEGLNSAQFLRSDAANATSTTSTFLTVTQNGSGAIAEFFGPNSSSVFSLLSGGNVGVGTTTPYARLSVVGETVAEYFTATSTTATSTLPELTATGLKITGYCEGCFTLNGLTPDTQTFAAGTSGTDFNISSSASVHTFNIPDAGASARGLVTTGSQTFAGAKTFSSTPLTLSADSAVLDFSSATGNKTIQTGGSSNLIFSPGGNIGIGTTSPFAKLTAWGGGTGSAKLFELVNNASTTVFSVLDDGTTEIGVASAGNVIIQTSATGDVVLLGVGTTTPDADVTIVSNQTASNTYLFTIATTTGDVIDRKFTVDSDGDVAIDSSLTSPADYAEAFRVVGSKNNYEPGDIVVLSETLPGAVEKSSEPYERNIAGVYSTRPGIIGTLAEDTTAYKIEEENDIPVGILGRVPTKISTENGPINVGDHITTSSIPGVGMKATKAGKSIGRALESFNGNGVGKIMVFVQNGYFFGEDFLTLEEEFSDLEGLFASSTDSESQDGSSTIVLMMRVILDHFESLGLKIVNGIAYFKQIVAERLTVGSPEKPSGITLYDELTGEPYCLSIRGGEMVNRPGQCNDLDNETPDSISTVTSSASGSSQVNPLSEDEGVNEEDIPDIEESPDVERWLEKIDSTEEENDNNQVDSEKNEADNPREDQGENPIQNETQSLETETSSEEVSVEEVPESNFDPPPEEPEGG